MRISKPFEFYLPKKIISAVELLPSNSRDKGFLVVNHLMNKLQIHKDKQYCPIDKKRFEKKFGFDPYRTIKLLLNNNILNSDGIYSSGKKALYYKINDELLSEIGKITIEPNTQAYKFVNRSITLLRKNYNISEPYIKAMRDSFNKLEIDKNIAEDIIENVFKDNSEINKKNHAIRAVKYFDDKRFRYFSRNKTNKRIDTNLTNMKRELKNALIGDFTGIDFKNSQPTQYALNTKFLFENDNSQESINRIKRTTSTTQNEITKDIGITLCLHLDSSGFSSFIGKSVLSKILNFPKNCNFDFYRNLSLFQSTCFSGKFYDLITEKTNGEFSRQEIKAKLIPVFFSQTLTEDNRRPYYLQKQLLKSAFPSLFHLLDIINLKHNKQFAVYLQRAESLLFIDYFCQILYNNGIVPSFTVHDSIFVQSHEAERTLQIMEESFELLFGFKPMLDVQRYGTANYKPTQLTSSIKVA